MMSKKSDGSQVKESTDSSATMDEEDSKGKQKKKSHTIYILTNPHFHTKENHMKPLHGEKSIRFFYIRFDSTV